ncbi:MAG: hypothetical protein A2W22_00785 [Candidatus Levybacteria bacterium RBG_16_35_11]|nr:MAG: hypothetical protein A2W22_00785 [Candidatus Levybacteria bacterium RBG_16_35_11]
MKEVKASVSNKGILRRIGRIFSGHGNHDSGHAQEPLYYPTGDIVVDSFCASRPWFDPFELPKSETEPPKPKAEG